MRWLRAVIGPRGVISQCLWDKNAEPTFEVLYKTLDIYEEYTNATAEEKAKMDEILPSPSAVDSIKFKEKIESI